MNAKMALLGPLAFLAAWFLVTACGLFDAFFLPSPAAVFSELGRLLSSGMVANDAMATMWRVGASFSVALMAGIPLGLCLGSSKKAYKSMEFLIDFFRSLPATAIFPLFVLVFGIGDESKIAVAAFASVLIITFNTAHGVMHSKKSRVFAAKLMGATNMQVFRKIAFWDSLPQTFVGIRTAVSLSLVIVVVTEMFIGTSAGLGKLIVDFQYVYNVTGMYAAIIMTGIMGYLLNFAVMLLEKKVVHWAGK